MKATDRSHPKIHAQCRRLPRPSRGRRWAASGLRSFLAVGLLLALALPQVGAQAQAPSAILSVGSASGAPGATGIGVAVSLTSQNGAEVSAINFDIAFDSSRLTVGGVSLGSGASSAGKSLSSSQPSAGTLRIVIQGGVLPIPDGTLATVSFNVNGGASPGASSLSLGNAIASDPLANPVPLALNNGTFTVTAPPATNTSLPTATARHPTRPRAR
ncbi:MAG: Cohesin protein [Anaerolineales bacterium]|nr:Cohesin protein [Anaerolineales bacterium]